jgi:hypothetical protein
MKVQTDEGQRLMLFLDPASLVRWHIGTPCLLQVANGSTRESSQLPEHEEIFWCGSGRYRSDWCLSFRSYRDDGMLRSPWQPGRQYALRGQRILQVPCLSAHIAPRPTPAIAWYTGVSGVHTACASAAALPRLHSGSFPYPTAY